MLLWSTIASVGFLTIPLCASLVTSARLPNHWLDMLCLVSAANQIQQGGHSQSISDHCQLQSCKRMHCKAFLALQQIGHPFKNIFMQGKQFLVHCLSAWFGFASIGAHMDWEHFDC